MIRICEVDCKKEFKCHFTNPFSIIYLDSDRYFIECGTYCPPRVGRQRKCCYLCNQECIQKRIDIMFLARWLKFIRKIKNGKRLNEENM